MYQSDEFARSPGYLPLACMRVTFTLPRSRIRPRRQVSPSYLQSCGNGGGKQIRTQSSLRDGQTIAPAPRPSKPLRKLAPPRLMLPRGIASRGARIYFCSWPVHFIRMNKSAVDHPQIDRSGVRPPLSPSVTVNPDRDLLDSGKTDEKNNAITEQFHLSSIIRQFTLFYICCAV